MRRARMWLAVAAVGCNSGTPGRGKVNAAPAHPLTFAVGRTADSADIAAWNLDVNPLGEGLPPGSGNSTRGAEVFAKHCATCHGVKGEGGTPPNPKLVGREPREGFPFATDLQAVKTIGNYWPYATTLFDYIRRAMPQSAPGSLNADDTYAVIAWLLAENEVIARDVTIDATSLPQVRMPARDRFVRDDRTGGPEFR